MPTLAAPGPRGCDGVVLDPGLAKGQEPRANGAVFVCPSWLKQFRGVARKVATRMAAATNAATCFLLIAKQLEEKVAR